MTLILAATFGSVMKWIGYVLVALVCLMIMIVIHEFGHYIAGKAFRFKINEFSIGFGPAIFKRTNPKNGEVFAIRCLPIGGYCAFAGEEEEGVKEGDFNSKPPWQRIIVLFMGAFFNYLSALILVSIFFMSYGEFFPTVAATYAFDDGSEQVLREGDVITKIDGKYAYSLLEVDKIQQLMRDKQTLTLTLLRDGEEIEFDLIKRSYTYDAVIDDEGNTEQKTSVGLGISMTFSRQQLGFFQSIGHGFMFGFDLIRVTFRAIGSIFTGGASLGETMGGTFTAISALAQLTSQGFAAVMYGLCVLSMSIAMMNLMPLPALDGSKIVLCLIEWARGKPLNRKVEGIIHTVGLFLLLGLAILLDILHFFT